MKARFSIDSIAGYSHYAAEQDRLSRERAATRTAWARFAAAWGYVGNAIANGVKPDVPAWTAALVTDEVRS